MRRFLFPLVAVMALVGCEKPLDDVMDYYPRVVTESVTVQPDGSVVAVGRITSEGDSPLEAVGFCASTSPNPEMLDAQGLGTVNGDRFTVVYDGFSTVGTYYFRAFATNGSGYSYGNVLSISDIEAEPITPPCTPTLNSVVLGGGLMPESYYPGQIGTPEEYLGEWTFTANTSAHHFTYLFGSALETRTYTTTTNSHPGTGQVRISFYSGFTSGALQNGSTVYVNQLSPTEWELTVCQAPWGTGDKKLTTRFRVHS